MKADKLLRNCAFLIPLYGVLFGVCAASPLKKGSDPSVYVLLYMLARAEGPLECGEGPL